jgi:hypothetical protein
MKYAGSLVTALTVSALGLLAVPAQAAPATGIAGDLKPLAGEGADVERVRHGCYWHRGHWHCGRSYRRDYYYYGPRRHYHRHHHHRHWRYHYRHY